MEDFVEYIIKNLVGDPNAVRITCLEGERGLLIEIRVDQGDVGKVIGRRGQTIQSIRTLVTSACARLGRQARVELIEG